MKISELRVLGRNTQGVRLINLRGKDFIASITKVPTENDEESMENEQQDGAVNTDNQQSQENPDTPQDAQ
jgi:DNA gyrase subunit A